MFVLSSFTYHNNAYSICYALKWMYTMMSYTIPFFGLLLDLEGCGPAMPDGSAPLAAISPASDPAFIAPSDSAASYGQTYSHFYTYNLHNNTFAKVNVWVHTSNDYSSGISKLMNCITKSLHAFNRLLRSIQHYIRSGNVKLTNISIHVWTISWVYIYFYCENYHFPLNPRLSKISIIFDIMKYIPILL